MGGRPRYLSIEEEEELVSFLFKSSSVGYPRTRKDVVAIVQTACSKRGMNVNVTHGWWQAFYHRHPYISLRITSSLSLARAKASDPAVISNYFDMLEDCMIKNDLLDKPAQIFNIDETGMPFNPASPRGICKRGVKTVPSISSGDTVVGCVSAAGYCIPPMVIWDRKTLQPHMTAGEVPSTVYGLSEKGWIDQELFSMWFQNHFLRYAPSTRPLLLLMDGHASHYCPDTIRLAAQQKIILFTFPPNTTHLTQPLDKGCFGPLKKEWQNVCHRFMSENPGKVVSRYSFSDLFRQAWFKSMTMNNILAAF